MAEGYEERRSERERIRMIENSISDWRRDLMEEHPYVEIMPKCGDQPKESKKEESKKKEKKED